ncbi:MAG TPA: adenylosuccinate synthetase [Candidatus Tyrphobacter sp.]
MSIDVVVGIQWGDEGKGRIVDLLARDYAVVARFGGGDNAGHTLVVGERKIALRLVPSGALQPGVELFVGGGCVVNPQTLVEEFETLAHAGVDLQRIAVSDRAHVVLPEHVERDRHQERVRGGEALGTTGRGIGPAYADRAARTGMTVRRFCDEGASPQAKRIAPHVVDGVEYLHERLECGMRILAEGAQGTMLDVVYGTYPFVTSSQTLSGAACTGLGVGPGAIGRVIGVAKAYCTRVGAGPFPSELHDEHGERLRERGREFGTVTGRPRRCGWFDAVAGRYAARVNGLTSLAITKLDILSGFERIGIVTRYRESGVDVEYLDGWPEDIHSVRRLARLPRAARAYVERLQRVMGVPIESVSVGPERDQLAG